MSKYIDPDVLKAEIEKRKNICKGIFERDSDTYYQGKAVAYQETLSFLDTLQQEQPCDTCTNDKGCVTCKDGELWEGKEQPSEDLEKEIEKFLASEDSTSYDNAGTYKVSFKDPIKIARHFYELGKKSK